jgi:hypothetical protein
MEFDAVTDQRGMELEYTLKEDRLFLLQEWIQALGWLSCFRVQIYEKLGREMMMMNPQKMNGKRPGPRR